MESYDSIHGSAWNHYDSMHGKVWNEKQKFEILENSNFRSTCVSLSGNNWKTTGFDLNWKTENDTIKLENWSAFKLL